MTDPWLAEDENGNPLDVGRKHRTVSTPLRRALFARDRGCTFPGCHRTRYVDCHHLKPWFEDGETIPRNLTLLCTHHHELLHQGGFSIVKEDDGTLRFVTADGCTIPRGGYRLEDFVDDELATEQEVGEPSRDGFCTEAVHGSWPRHEVREPASVYAIGRGTAPAMAPGMTDCRLA